MNMQEALIESGLMARTRVGKVKKIDGYKELTETSLNLMELEVSIDNWKLWRLLEEKHIPQDCCVICGIGGKSEFKHKQNGVSINGKKSSKVLYKAPTWLMDIVGKCMVCFTCGKGIECTKT